MPALDFRAFAAGFATQAQKIEEESAKIGMDLLKKAMEDFREEAKDYKPKYEEEIRNKKEQAMYLKDTIGLDDTQVKVLLDRGDLAVKDFVANAKDARDFQQLDDYKGLVRLAEAQEPITGFDIIDYIDSGAYVKTKAPVYVGPEGFKTGVFGREVSLGDKSTVESTKSAYIPEKGGYEGDVPSSMGATVDLTASKKRGAFEPISRTDDKGYRSSFTEAFADFAGTNLTQNTDGTFRFADKRAAANTKLKQDMEGAYQAWISSFKPVTGEDKQVDPTTIRNFALSYVNMLNNKAIEEGTSKDNLFYKEAVGLEGLSDPKGSTLATGAPKVTGAQTPAVTQATPSNVPTDPKQHHIISTLIPKPTMTQFQAKQGKSRKDRISIIKNILIQVYGYDVKKAEADATAMVL
jgi:hypothetical protein